MEQIQLNTPRMLMMQIVDETIRYNDAIKKKKEFSETKEIKDRMRKLGDELQELLLRGSKENYSINKS